MNLRFRSLAGLSLLLVAACGAPQKPATFVTSGSPESGLDTVARTLAADGHPSPTIDRQTGIVSSTWQDTGFMFGQVGNVPATIVRRFTVVVGPAAQGSSVTVRMDVKRCAQGAYVIQNTVLQGSCEEINVIPEKFQGDIDALAAKVQQAMAAPAVASAH
ncbi:MAG: hypothetical protein JWP97_506 [Labilithrix sp.]|nr:hypothetical protein [Labilithrix sp.]